MCKICGENSVYIPSANIRQTRYLMLTHSIRIFSTKLLLKNINTKKQIKIMCSDLWAAQFSNTWNPGVSKQPTS